MSKVKELSTDQWKKAIDRLDAARVPMVTFTGGEPTQRADIAELVAYAKRMVTRLNTNGVNLTPELVAQLKQAGLDSLQVTLYSRDAAVHNGLVGSAHFEDTVQGIRNAVAAGLDISINTPLCKKNADYIKTLEFIRSLGVRFVTVSGLICTGMAGINHEDYDLSSEELFAIVKSAKEFCNANEMEIDFTSPGLIEAEKLEAMGMNVPMCGACLSNMAIAPDGTVVPCQSWLGADASLGNILTDPFKKIWQHPLCKSLRNMPQEQALSCPFRTGKGGDRI
jgi:MoaA/NifB/PqqE/SkfB family radical SAM enzyme